MLERRQQRTNTSRLYREDKERAYLQLPLLSVPAVGKGLPLVARDAL